MSELQMIIQAELAKRLEVATREAVASASARVANQYAGQSQAVVIRVTPSGDKIDIVLTYDKTRNPMADGSSAYWISEYGSAGRAAAPVLRVAAAELKAAL